MLLSFSKKNYLLFFCWLFFIVLSISSFAIEDIYALSEDNAIASSLCKAINFAQTAMIPIAGIMLAVTGFSVFKGEFSPSMLITFALGIGIVRNPGPLLEILSPDTDLQYACKCNPVKKVIREMKDSSNNIYWQEFEISTGVDEDCNPIR